MVSHIITKLSKSQIFAKKINISERQIRRQKNRAYFYLAVYSNQVEFIYDKTYYFYLD